MRCRLLGISDILSGRADVETVAGAEGPGVAGGWLVTYEDAAAYGAEGGGVEVEGSIEGFPSREEGSDVGLAEKVEGDFGLRENFFP